MKILLLTGGNSSERKISFMSAKNVKQALIENKHTVKIYDLKNGYQPIIKLSRNFDILFPVLHGEEGEGGKLHKFLSKIKKPIVGGRNYKGFQKAWYKIPFKKYCDKNKIKTAKWKIIKSEKDVLKFGFPCVLKTSNGGSSREVTVVKSEKDLKTKEAKHILNLKTPKFVEKYLQGTEVTVGILNEKVLPFLEIVPTIDSWFSYKTKYDNTTWEIPFAPSVDKKIQNKIQKTALKIHKTFNLGSYSRTDFIVSNGNYYALEINTIPGLTKDSLLPKQAKAAGMSFNKFVEELIKSAK